MTKIRPVTVIGCIAYVTVSNQHMLFFIDSQFAEIVGKYNWSSNNKGHAITNIVQDGVRKTITLHQLILGDKKGFKICHINGNKWDNMLENLKHVTVSECHYNIKRHKNNTSGYKGVCYLKKYDKYRASIAIKGKKIRIGDYATALEAAQAYEEAARKYQGEFFRPHLNLE